MLIHAICMSPKQFVAEEVRHKCTSLFMIQYEAVHKVAYKLSRDKILSVHQVVHLCRTSSEFVGYKWL